MSVAELYPHVAERLDGLDETSPGQWICRCPSHEDEKASLSVSIGSSGALLIRCHAGCQTNKVVDDLGLRMSDLFPSNGNPRAATLRTGLPQAAAPRTNGTQKSNGATQRKFVKTVTAYDYKDERGELLFQVLRKEDKTFSQCRPDGRGGVIWSVKDVRKVPYRLPELLASDPESITFIPEGEKDVDGLREIGLTATTNSGGAGKWTDEMSEHLRSRKVVILPDNDKPGQEHARKVEQSLTGIARSVRILEIPGLAEKQDVSDWLADGGTAEELLRLASEQPEDVAGDDSEGIQDATEQSDPGHNEPSHGAPQSEPQETRAAENVKSTLHSDGEHAPPNVAPGRQLTNYTVEFDDDGKPRKEPKPIGEVVSEIFEATNGFPKRVGSSLFVVDGESVFWIEKGAQLNAWLGLRTGTPPHFAGGDRMHGKEDIVSALQQRAEAFDGFESMPHEPPIPGIYYNHRDVEPGDGTHLRKMMEFFSPATSIDGDLLLAAAVTLFWGGPPGSRPAFVLTGGGRGYGKTAFIKALARLAGGKFDIRPTEDFNKLVTRILSNDAQGKRILLLDNLKSDRFSSADLESLITNPIINGHKLFTGNCDRPNHMTVFVTVNGVNVSTDIAQRACIIELDRPLYSSNWESRLNAFIDEHRWQIVGDIIAFLKNPPHHLENFSRWGAWERDILQRLPEPSEAQTVILERQAGADAEAEEADIIEQHFRQEIEQIGCNPSTDAVFIPARLAAIWLGNALSDKLKTNQSTRILKQLIKEGRLKTLTDGRNRRGTKRGFTWVGECLTLLSDAQEHDAEDLTDHFREQRRAY